MLHEREKMVGKNMNAKEARELAIVEYEKIVEATFSSILSQIAYEARSGKFILIVDDIPFKISRLEDLGYKIKRIDFKWAITWDMISKEKKI